MMTKFFFLSIFSIFTFWSVFNPHDGANVRLSELMGYNKGHFRLDSNARDGSYFMGAD